MNLLIILLAGLSCFSQTNSLPIFSSPNNNSFETYLENNVQYPLIAYYNGVIGYIHISFKVSGAGNVSDVEVIRGVYEPMDKEAVRLVKALNGMWDTSSIEENGDPIEMKIKVKFDIKSHPDLKSTLKYYKKANKYLEKGNYIEAKNLFKTIFEERPNDIEVQYKLSECYYKLNLIEESCNLISDCLYSKAQKLKEEICK